MKKIIIASTNRIDLLSEKCEVIDDEGLIINRINDISLAIQPESRFEWYLEEVFNAHRIPIIGGTRKNKILQSILLGKYGINSPKTYYNSKTLKPIDRIELFDAVVGNNSKGKQLIAKPIAGARGIGVGIITRDQFKDCINNPKLSVKVLYKEQTELIKKEMDDVSPDYIEGCFRNGEMVIQEFVEIKNEYRLMLFSDGVSLMYERVKKDNSILGNLAQGATAIAVDYKDFNTNTKFLSIIDQLTNMMRDQKYPWLSIDLYLDNNGDYGVIEFQMEFAYTGFDPEMIISSMHRSLNYFIK